MDNRFTFINFFIDKDVPVYVANKSSSNTNKIHEFWKSLGFRVEKWSGDYQEKYLFFYKSRIASKACNSNDISEYIIVPSLENPRWIILNQKNVIGKHGPIIKPTSLKARVVWSIAKALNIFNLFTFIFPYRIIAKNSPMGGAVFDSKRCDASIMYTGAPGKYQKFTIQYNDELCNPSYYLKTSNSSSGIGRIVNESKALKKLGRIELEYIAIPELKDIVNSNGFYGIVQSNILDNEKISISLSDMDIFAICELYNKFDLKERAVSEYLSEIGFKEYSDEFPMLVDIFDSFKDKQITLAISHGDYIPWNRFISSNQVKIIDWETFKYRPLFYDICYFLIHKAVFIEHTSVMSAVAESVSCINGLLPNINATIESESANVKFYILLILVEIYIHYKGNGEVAGREFLRSLKNGIEELQIALAA